MKNKYTLLIIILLLITISKFYAQGNTCSNPIEINTPNIYSVDNTAGNWWYKFTAQESGVGIITTGSSTTLSTPRYLSSYEDTYIKVYEACGGNLIAESDDYSGLFSASRVEVNFVAGQEYYILFDNQFTNATYQFELFYWNAITGWNGSEAEPIAIDSDNKLVYGAYFTENWFTYTFPADGVFKTHAIGAVFPLYYEVTNNPGVYYFDSDEDDYGLDNGFMYTGSVGEVLHFKIRDDVNYNYDIITEFTSTLSLSENNTLNVIDIFPNPFKNKLFIEFNQLSINETITITINNILGQTAYAKTLANTELQELDLSLESGVYLLNIQTQTASKTYKIISE